MTKPTVSKHWTTRWPCNNVILLFRILLAEEVTRNSSADETANVNFLYDDSVHALRNTIRLMHKFCHRSTWQLCVGTHIYQIQWNNAM